MIRNSLKKSISLILTGAVIMGLSGCLDFGGGKKAVIEAAESYASNMASADASKLIKNSTLDKKSKEATALTELLSTADSSDDELAFYKAVENTIEYEIDEDSVTVNKDSASIDIVFSIADYQKVLADNYKNIDELTAAIKKADTKEVKFTAEFAKEDKEWIPDNVGSKKFLKLYDYRNAEINLSLSADMIAEMIDRDSSTFWFTEDDKYVNAMFIEYDYYFDSKVYDYEGQGIQLYFTLSKDGTLIYTGPTEDFGISSSLICRVDGDLIGLDTLSYFESGNYTIKLYLVGEDGDDLIDTQSIEVEKTVIPTVTGGPDDIVGEPLDGEGEYYAFNDISFRNNVLAAKWFDYDACKIDDETYSTDVQTIAFSIEVKPTCNIAVDYSFYYTDREDQDAITEALYNPLCTETGVRPTTYTNGTFYDIEYQVDGEAAPGFYMFVIFESGTDNVLMYGFCYVA